MSAPDGSNAGGMLNGHGVGVAMIAIFVGVGLVVAFVASDGAVFGLNFGSASDNAPARDAGSAGVLSRNAFDEESGTGSATPERGATLSEEESGLLAMSNSSWDSIAVRHIASSQDKLAQPGTELASLSDRIATDVDRDEDDPEVIDTPADEEEPQDDTGQDNSGSGSGSGGQSGSGNGGGSGSGSNSTGTNSTGSGGSSGSSGSDGGSNSTGMEASVSIG